jgi:hypothetical protein
MASITAKNHVWIKLKRNAGNLTIDQGIGMGSINGVHPGYYVQIHAAEAKQLIRDGRAEYAEPPNGGSGQVQYSP